MTTASDSFPFPDPTSTPVDEATWTAIREGAPVDSVDGEHLGRVADVGEHTLCLEVPHDLLETEELYVPHLAVAAVDGGRVRLSWRRDELAAANEHYRRHHTREG